MSVQDFPVGGVAPRGLRGYDAKALSEATSVETGDSGLVQQHFGVDADINVIMSRFGMTGDFPSGVDAGMYGDFTGILDYDSAVTAVERAQNGFMSLPPEVRERFGNDPGELIRFAQSVSAEQFAAAMAGPVASAAPPEGGGGS